MSISLNPQTSIQKPFLNTLQEQPINKDTNVSHIAQGILTREEAKLYKESLSPENRLYNEITVKLSNHESGIIELSNGMKINATKERLKGGFFAEIGGTIISILTSKTVTETVKKAAKGAWEAIFKKSPESEEKDKVTAAEFQAKLDKLESGPSVPKADFEKLLKQLNTNLTNAVEDEDNVAMVETKMSKLLTYKDLMAELSKAAVDKEDVIKSHNKVDQSFQNCSKFIGNMGNLNVSGTGNTGINFGDTTNYQSGSKHEENKSTIQADKIGQLNQKDTYNYGGQKF